jgi:hypothetical protein
MNRMKWMRMWSVAVGSMDALTGVLLVVSPAMGLGLLGIDPPGEEGLVFLSWIGVFVMAVGMSYGLALRDWMSAAVVWKFTGLVRLMVAAFLGVKVGMGALAAGWLVVAVSDGLVAVVQLAALAAGWGKEAKG